MKIVLIVCCIAVVAAIVAGCGRLKTHVSADVLDYDKTIFLDAEDLGEGSIGSSYKTDIVPVHGNRTGPICRDQGRLGTDRNTMTVATF